MRVCILSPIDRARRFELVGVSADEVFRHWAEPDELAEALVQLRLRPVPLWPRHSKKTFCDFSSVQIGGPRPLLSSRAREVLEPLMDATARWHALNLEEGEYWLCQQTRVLDILVPEQSVVAFRFDDTPDDIKTYVFRPEDLGHEWLFKVQPWPYHVLATDAFREAVQANRLTGFHFQPVWDSAHLPFEWRPSRSYVATRPEIFGPDGFVPNYIEFGPPEWQEQVRVKKTGRFD